MGRRKSRSNSSSSTSRKMIRSNSSSSSRSMSRSNSNNSSRKRSSRIVVVGGVEITVVVVGVEQ